MEKRKDIDNKEKHKSIRKLVDDAKIIPLKSKNKVIILNRDNPAHRYLFED